MDREERREPSPSSPRLGGRGRGAGPASGAAAGLGSLPRWVPGGLCAQKGLLLPRAGRRPRYGVIRRQKNVARKQTCLSNISRLAVWSSPGGKPCRCHLLYTAFGRGGSERLGGDKCGRAITLVCLIGSLDGSGNALM